MAKDIKVIFHGTKAPSGKTTEIEYNISSVRLNQLKASEMFDIEMVENTVVESDSPDNTWTTSKIKNYLDSNNIDYLVRDSKAILLSKVEGDKQWMM